MCHERQYLFFFLVFCFCIRRAALLSVSFTSDSNFSFKIVWPLTIKHFLKLSEEFLRRILNASSLTNPFYHLVGDKR